jgi:Protein of unknown function (DUF3987)
MKFVDDFVDYCKDFTGCPEIFLKWSAVFGLSAIAGYKHVHRRGNWDVRPHLWMLLLGQSSSYKSTGLASIRRLLFEVSPGCLASQEYSHEALIQDVAENHHRVFIYDEAESYFRMLAQKYNAPMKSVMMQLYNNVPLRRQIKGPKGQGETYTIDHSYVCWGGASTPVQIATQMNGSTDLLSGMIPRFLIIPYFGGEDTIEDPPPDNKDKRRILTDKLSELSRVGEREYVYTADALELKHKWAERFNKRQASAESLLGAFYRKMRDEHIHKVAMLSAFERGVTQMEDQDVENAIELLWPVERAWPSLLERLTENEWTREFNRVRDFIQKGHKVERSDILRTCRGIRAQKLTAILEGLKQDGQIVIKNIDRDSAGRPKSIIEWIPEVVSPLV